MLTWKEGYQAAYGFLDDTWDGMNEEDQELLAELDAFLGGMMLQEDESSTDPVILELWHEAVAQTTRRGGWSDLSPEEAYQAMTLFLDLWARDNSDGTILGLCKGLADAEANQEDWTRAVQKVLNGEFDFYFGLTEEAQEVKVTLIYLVTGDMVLTKRSYSDWREIQAEYMGYQTSLPDMTYEKLTNFFADDFGAEENWPIDPKDLREFFESDEETAWFADE